MKRFRAIRTRDAREGLCLYEDIRDQAGNLLLPKTHPLTGAALKALLRRNVETLLVVDEPLSEEQLEAERSRVRLRLAHLCRHAGQGRANRLLRSVVEQYRMAQLS